MTSKIKRKKEIKIKKQRKIFIYGRHILEEALNKKPFVIKKVFLALEHKEGDLHKKLLKLNIPVSFLKQKEGEKIVGKDAAHQGFIALLDLNKLVITFEDFIKDINPSLNTSLALLDEIVDPQNVGSIIRSAAAFGISGVLLPQRRQSGITSVVVKVSSGMVFSLPLVEINNVNYALDTLKEKGFKVIALDVKGNKILDDSLFKGPVVFVLGNENYGIRLKTLERADERVRIPISSRCESLNVAVSSAIVFYVWYKNWGKNL